MNKTISNLLLAILIYAPTLILVPTSLVYLIIVIIGLLNWLSIIEKKGFKKDDLTYLIFLLVSFSIYVIGKQYALDNFSKSLNDFIPYTLLIVATVFFAKLINKKVLKYVLYFFIIEAIIANIQFIIGVPYFIKPEAISSYEFGESDFLYYNRVYGLSESRSIVALKFFIAILLVNYQDFSIKRKNLFYAILAGGLIVTFNRTAIVATIFFVLIKFYGLLKKGKWYVKYITFISIFIAIIILYQYFDVIAMQFFRGKEVDLSGRDSIYAYYLDFIQANPFFGNFFTKYWINLASSGKVFHAHNSYLQTFANMGLIIGGLLFFYIFRHINKQNFIYIVPILIYSSFQYGILWGVSFQDIIFFYFLFHINLDKMKSSSKVITENSSFIDEKRLNQ